ncbi:MAG: hypothetical protein HQ596_04935 [Candidatus Saganbacteria bacterium]|nr:hypothetical protein [Candidatus Saganbacteria bacterium]
MLKTKLIAFDVNQSKAKSLPSAQELLLELTTKSVSAERLRMAGVAVSSHILSSPQGKEIARRALETIVASLDPFFAVHPDIHQKLLAHGITSRQDTERCLNLCTSQALKDAIGAALTSPQNAIPPIEIRLEDARATLRYRFSQRSQNSAQEVLTLTRDDTVDEILLIDHQIVYENDPRVSQETLDSRAPWEYSPWNPSPNRF